MRFALGTVVLIVSLAASARARAQDTSPAHALAPGTLDTSAWASRAAPPSSHVNPRLVAVASVPFAVLGTLLALGGYAATVAVSQFRSNCGEWSYAPIPIVGPLVTLGVLAGCTPPVSSLVIALGAVELGYLTLAQLVGIALTVASGSAAHAVRGDGPRLSLGLGGLAVTF